MNEVKTEVLITKPPNNAPPIINVPIIVNETISLKVVKKVKYLGFNFHKDLHFSTTIKDLNTKHVLSRYTNLMYNQFVPIHVKKLIMQRYITSQLLSNAPVIGLLMVQTPKLNKGTFKEKVSDKITTLLSHAYHLPNASRSTSKINLYENANMTMPHHLHYCKCSQH
jgi:hypothetical protein